MSQANKRGYHKGCFGGPTVGARREARDRIASMRFRARSFATKRVHYHMSKSEKFAKRKCSGWRFDN